MKLFNYCYPWHLQPCIAKVHMLFGMLLLVLSIWLVCKIAILIYLDIAPKLVFTPLYERVSHALTTLTEVFHFSLSLFFLDASNCGCHGSS